MQKTLLMLLILLALPGLAWCGQQAPSSQPKEQSQPPHALLTAEGQLTKVDIQKRVIWIKTSDGEEIQFNYTKQTEIEGISSAGAFHGGTVEGLAGMDETLLKIQYKSEAGVNTAIKIEVQPVSA